MNRVIISKSKSIYENLAIEEELFHSLAQEECILFLWQSDKTLVLGNNQSAYLECNLSYCEENQIEIARRLSGGGCVYQDLGNLNYSFLYYKTPDSKQPEQNCLNIILSVLKRYNIKKLEKKKNDILAENKKISGIAYYEEDEKRILHGTLLVDVDMEHLSNALRVNAKKLKFNGVESVRARVANLVEFDSTICPDGLQRELAREFLNQYNGNQIEYRETVNNRQQLEKYKDSSWIFGESPNCSLLFEEKTEIGLFQLVCPIEQGKIKMPMVYSDAEVRYDFTSFLKKIENQVYKEQELKEQWKKAVDSFRI